MIYNNCNTSIHIAHQYYDTFLFASLSLLFVTKILFCNNLYKDNLYVASKVDYQAHLRTMTYNRFKFVYSSGSNHSLERRSIQVYY